MSLFYRVYSVLTNMLYKETANALITQYGYCNIHSCQFNDRVIELQVVLFFFRLLRNFCPHLCLKFKHVCFTCFAIRIYRNYFSTYCFVLVSNKELQVLGNTRSAVHQAALVFREHRTPNNAKEDLHRVRQEHV